MQKARGSARHQLLGRPAAANVVNQIVEAAQLRDAVGHGEQRSEVGLREHGCQQRAAVPTAAHRQTKTAHRQTKTLNRRLLRWEHLV